MARVSTPSALPAALLFLTLTLAFTTPVWGQTDATAIPLPLYLDSRLLGEIPTRIRMDDTLELRPGDLADLLENYLDPATLMLLRTQLPDDYLSLTNLTESELLLQFDLDELVVRVSIPAALRRTRVISLRGTPRDPAGTPVAPAPFSVILNADAGVSYSYQPDTLETTAVLDPAVHLFGVALESRVAFSNSEDPVELDYARATWDIPGTYYRVQAGDLSWRSMELFGVSRILGGAMFRRNGTTNGQRRTRVLLDGIFLEDDGEVIIEVNGRTVRRLSLAAGTYRLSGVGLSSGINVVRVTWTGPDGPQEMEIIVPTDNRLLDPGEFDWGVAAGLSDRDLQRPVATGYQRLGAGEFITVGLRQGLELEEQESIRQIDLGLEVLTSTMAGTFALTPGVGIGPEERRFITIPLRYTWVDSRAERYRNLDVSTAWRQAVNTEGAMVQQEISGTVATTVAAASGMAITPRFTAGYDTVSGLPRLDGRLTMRTAAGSRTSVRVDAGISYREELTFLASINVSAAFPERRQNLFLQQNLTTQDFSAFWNRYPDESIDPFDARASLQMPIDPERMAVVSGGGGFRTPVVQGSVNHLLAFIPAGGDARNSTSARLQTGVVYVDGVMALTRPVSDSFIVISPADHVADRTFSLRRGAPGRTSVVAGSPVMLGSVRAHETREVAVEMEEFDPSIDTDELAWVVQPLYRSGTHIRIDPPRRLQVAGTLVDSADRPVTLVLGRTEDGADFFTDETGYFEIYDMLPGTYVLRLPGRPGLVYTLRLDDAGDQRRDVGTLRPREEG